MKLAKLFPEIQYNTEQSIIKIVEDYWSKGNKNKNKNTKSQNTESKFAPRFTPTEQQSSPPIH